MVYVYILRSVVAADQIYVGITKDLKQRLSQHNMGTCLHTVRFMPWSIVYYELAQNYEMGCVRERQIKKWSRAKKEALIAGDMGGLKGLSRCRQRSRSADKE